VSDARLQFVEGAGGARLAVHRLGEGRPVLLLHGLFSSAAVNWIKFGHAARLVEAGFEAIMPDLRAHGQSDTPHNLDAYPADVLVKDAFAVVSALGLADFDLGGFSLGSRTAVRAVIEGLAPRRLVLGGMGMEGLGQWEQRSAFFVEAIDNFETIKRGDPHYLAQQFMKTMKVDRRAARLLLGSVADIDVATLQRVRMPTLVVCGVDDNDNGSAPALAGALANSTYVEVPGTHMSSVTQLQFGEAIVHFLSA
jgi:pimeloyl-ACP methyl ester carboxylesterase